MVRQTNENHDQWSDCPPGTIGQLHDRIVSQRKRRVAVGMGGPMLVVMLLGLGVWNFSRVDRTPQTEFDFGGVTCSYVQENIQQFKMRALEPAERDAVAIHLGKCPVCREIMKSMNDQASDMADNEVSRNSNIGSQTHRVLIAATVK